MNRSVAMKRLPPAAGSVIARISRSATSRTSTNEKPSRGIAGIPFISRSISCRENERSSLSTGPMIAPGFTVASRSSARLVADELPSRALGDRLRARVRGQRGVVPVGPVRLRVGRAVAGRAAAPDGGDRRGHHDPLDAGVQARPQDAQRTVAGGDDELVRVLRLCRRERRGDMEDVGAAGDGLGPPGVVAQIGGDDREPAVRLGARRRHRRADVALAGGVADGRAHRVTAVEQLRDAPAAEVAGPAGDEDGLIRGVAHTANLVRRRRARGADPRLQVLPEGGSA